MAKQYRARAVTARNEMYDDLHRQFPSHSRGRQPGQPPAEASPFTLDELNDSDLLSWGRARLFHPPHGPDGGRSIFADEHQLREQRTGIPRVVHRVRAIHELPEIPHLRLHPRADPRPRKGNASLQPEARRTLTVFPDEAPSPG